MVQATAAIVQPICICNQFWQSICGKLSFYSANQNNLSYFKMEEYGTCDLHGRNCYSVSRAWDDGDLMPIRETLRRNSEIIRISHPPYRSVN